MNKEPEIISEIIPTEVKNIRKISVLIPEANEFLLWASSMGAKVSSENWIIRTIRGYEKLESSSEEDFQHKYTNIFPNTGELQYNLVDFLHLGQIMTNIGDQDKSLLAEKLTDLVKGPNSLLEESPSNNNTKSRNIRFELFVAATMNAHGYTAVLTDPNPDILLKRQGKSAGVECKRAYSYKSLFPLINEANSQFEKRAGNKFLNANILAFDVTRTITEGTFHLSGDPIIASKNAAELLHELSKEIINQFRLGKYRNIDIVMLYYIDHVQPDSTQAFTIHGLTQTHVFDNPKALRKRRRYGLNFLLFMAKNKGAL